MIERLTELGSTHYHNDFDLGRDSVVQNNNARNICLRPEGDIGYLPWFRVTCPAISTAAYPFAAMPPP